MKPRAHDHLLGEHHEWAEFILPNGALLRLAARCTQKQAADRFGVSQQAVSLIEKRAIAKVYKKLRRVAG